MKNIINKLYTGEFYKLKSTEEKQLQKKMKIEETRGEKHDALWNTLSEKQQDLFREWELEYGRIWEEEVEKYYMQGFKMGALLGLEIGDADFED